MGKMQKMAQNWLDGDTVNAVIREHETCTVQFKEEPHLEKNEKYGNTSYHVKVTIKENDDERTWNMNGRTADFLSEKYGGDTRDFLEKEEQVVATSITTKDGITETIYPKEFYEQMKGKKDKK